MQIITEEETEMREQYNVSKKLLFQVVTSWVFECVTCNFYCFRIALCDCEQRTKLQENEVACNAQQTFPKIKMHTNPNKVAQ